MTHKAGSAKRRKIEMQPTRTKACRSLFGKPSAEFSKRLEEQVEKLFQDEAARCMVKWNFDASAGKPTEGNWHWEACEPVKSAARPNVAYQAAISTVRADKAVPSSVAALRNPLDVENVHLLLPQPSKLIQNLKQTKIKGKHNRLQLSKPDCNCNGVCFFCFQIIIERSRVQAVHCAAASNRKKAEQSWRE